MTVYVGEGAFSASPVHVAWEVDGVFLHGNGPILWQRVMVRGAKSFATGLTGSNIWFDFSVPILDAGAAATAGYRNATCVGAAATAIAR